MSTRILDKRGKVASLDYKFTGTEPEWNDAESLSVLEYYDRQHRALQFYGYYCDQKFLKDLVVAWMPKNGYSKEYTNQIKNAPPSVLCGVAGKFVRMLDQGMPDQHPDAKEHFEAKDIKNKILSASGYIHRFINDAQGVCTRNNVSSEEKKEKPKVKKTNPAVYLENKINAAVISPLEDVIDSICEVTEKTPPAKIPTLNLGNFLRTNKIPARGVKYVIAWIDKQLEEFGGALNKTDPELVEGYGWLKTAQLRRVVTNFEKMREDAITYSAIKQKDRKPRTKKIKTADRQITKLKFAINNKEYALDSIDPSRIPFGQRLYTFNVKYRQLTIYLAENATGFSVKGSTIYDFDKDKSVTMTLRKPLDILPLILSGTPRKIDKLIDGLKIKTKPAKGRCNENIILLRAFDK